MTAADAASDYMLTMPSPIPPVIDPPSAGLLYLEEAYDKSEPSTIWQWRHDRRNGREWATLWAVCLVLVWAIVFGLI
jgi:hypothetical protein